MSSPDPNSRFMAWSALAVFSAVALTAFETDSDSNDKSAADKWVLSVTAISMSFAFFAIVAHFVMRDNFEGKTAESGFAGLLIIFWAAGLPVIMDPDNGLAQSKLGNGVFFIENTNLYFSSWGAFIANLYIVASLAKDQGVADVSAASKKTTLWVALFAASMVVMVASSRFFKSFCDDGSSTCKRTKYAISLGAVGTVFAFLLAAMTTKDKLPIMAESVMSVLLLIMYCFGVGYITFGSGPGTTIGNLYFATWGGFIVTMLLTAGCIRQRYFANEEDAGTEPPETNPAEADEVPKV